MLRFVTSFVTLLESLRKLRGADYSHAPVNQGPAWRDPFQVLVACIISQRTRDAQTHAVSRRLFAAASTPARIAALPPARLRRLLKGAGFYNQKAKHILLVAAHVAKNGMPRMLDALVALPGVGRKTANIVLSHGYGRAAIAVDVHVHRIANRVGWVRTRTPEQTEMRLMELLPKRAWRGLNELLVAHGQLVCLPRRPRCGECVIRDGCKKIGVG